MSLNKYKIKSIIIKCWEFLILFVTLINFISWNDDTVYSQGFSYTEIVFEHLRQVKLVKKTYQNYFKVPAYEVLVIQVRQPK